MLAATKHDCVLNLHITIKYILGLNIIHTTLIGINLQKNSIDNIILIIYTVKRKISHSYKDNQDKFMIYRCNQSW